MDDLGGPKIEYHMPNGFTSTAYLDIDPKGGEPVEGVDKYTDARVTVRWTGERWVQLP